MTILIDNSTMEAIASCHTKVAMDRVLHLKPKAGNFFLEAGTAMHKAWEKFFTGADIEECVLSLRTYYSEKLPTFEDVPPSHDLTNLEQLFRIWASKHPNREFAWKSDHVEKGFQVRLHPDLNIDLIGRMDTFGTDGTGSYCVVDWKTTGRMDRQWLRKWKSSSQVSAYLYAMSRFYGPEVWVMYILGLEIKKVAMSDRKCNLHNMKYWDTKKREGCYKEHTKFQVESAYRTKRQIQEWYVDTLFLCKDYLHILDMVKTVEDIAKMPQQGMFNGGCYNCSYHDFCHVYNRNPQSVESLFEYKPWSPLMGFDKEDIFYEQ